MTREEQLDEIDAIKSVYDGDGRVQLNADSPTLSGAIVVELDPLNAKSTISANDHGELRSASVKVLSPVTLQFDLPIDYPETSPELNLECPWMHKELMEHMIKRLKEVCVENEGMAVLFFCCQTIVDEIKSREAELAEISLNNTPYALKHKITGLQILRQMTDSSEQSEDQNFDNGCYDCEVCFENKMGRDCVLFNPCGHVFCQDCVKGYYSSLLKEYVSKSMGCLSDGCESVATQAAVKRAVGELEYERYECILLERALGNMGDVVSCARPSCQKPVVVDANNVNLGRCSHCEYVFCTLCKRTYHGIDACRFQTADRAKLIHDFETGTDSQREEMARRFGGMSRLQRVIDTISNERWIEGNSKPCPKCKAAIEKNEGCNKMHCTKCDAMFCWLCNKLVNKLDPYSHFNSEGGGDCRNKLFEGVVESDDEDMDLDYFEFDANDEESEEENALNGGVGEEDDYILHGDDGELLVVRANINHLFR